MLGWIRDRARTRARASDLYGAVVAQARLAPFYERHGVPDTPEGRLEMIIVHLYLVFARLKALGDDGKRLSQGLAEAFVADVDDNLREFGIGDLSVPRKVKRAAAALYERLEDYAAAERAGPEALAAALGRHALAGADTKALAAYVSLAGRRLAARPDGEIGAGRLGFPSPDTTEDSP
jgi:cytochrome b pre-mRNA-processing protein 3